VSGPAGRLIGIAVRSARREPMRLIETAEVSVAAGIAGDHKGPKLRTRQVTLLALEDWRAALAALDPANGAVDLAWTVRRANLLTEGLVLPAAAGALIRIGPLLIEVMHPTFPCTRMTEAHPDLMRALAPTWRGGVSGRVLEGGMIRIGDAITIEAPGRPWRRPRLP
jgi:MOSC domain-containing protein YiiM